MISRLGVVYLREREKLAKEERAVGPIFVLLLTAIETGKLHVIHNLLVQKRHFYMNKDQLDAINKILLKEKENEPEIFEDSGTGDDEIII